MITEHKHCIMEDETITQCQSCGVGHNSRTFDAGGNIIHICPLLDSTTPVLVGDRPFAAPGSLVYTIGPDGSFTRHEIPHD